GPHARVNRGQRPHEQAHYEPLDYTEEKAEAIARPPEADRPETRIDEAEDNTADKEKKKTENGVFPFREHGAEIPLHAHEIHAKEPRDHEENEGGRDPRYDSTRKAHLLFLMYARIRVVSRMTLGLPR